MLAASTQWKTRTSVSHTVTFSVSFDIEHLERGGHEMVLHPGDIGLAGIDLVAALVVLDLLDGPAVLFELGLERVIGLRLVGRHVASVGGEGRAGDDERKCQSGDQFRVHRGSSFAWKPARCRRRRNWPHSLTAR